MTKIIFQNWNALTLIIMGHFALIQDDAANLFDLSLCKCPKLEVCSCKQNKVPVSQHTFLNDQRNSRRMTFRQLPTSQEEDNDTLDLDTRDLSSFESINCDDNNNLDDTTKGTSERDNESSSIDSDSNTIQLRSRLIKYEFDIETGGKHNNVKLHEVAIVADRYGVSDRATAALVSATLVDFKIVTPENQSQVVDRNKIRRHRKRTRK